jgi:S-formylglutathione hydrolase FrmB
MKALLLLLLVACGNNTQPASKAEPPAAPPASERVSTVTFHSDALGVDKQFVLYLPKDYATSGKRYPVFYYLHGLGGSETNWVEHGHLDQAADKLALDAIVVMPDGDDGFYIDSAAPVDYDACMRDGTGLFIPKRQPKDKTCVRANRYETYIVKDLVGYVDSHYRTITSRDGRAIAGLSMGGYGALQLALRHQDEFAAAVSHSGVDALLYHGPHPYVAGKAELTTDVAKWGNEAGDIGTWIRGRFGTDLAFWKARDPASLVESLEPGKLALYLDCGTEDVFLLNDEAAYLHDLLLAKKIDHAYYIGAGRHDFSFWELRVPESLKFLRDHIAKPQS